MIITNKLKLVVVIRNHITNINIKYSELLFSRISITKHITKQIVIRNRNRKAKVIRFSN